MEHNLWCQRCRTLRVLFMDNVQVIAYPIEPFLIVSCVFCRGPLVSVTDEIKKEYPDD